MVTKNTPTKVQHPRFVIVKRTSVAYSVYDRDTKDAFTCRDSELEIVFSWMQQKSALDGGPIMIRYYSDMEDVKRKSADWRLIHGTY